jgi:hypothetical protein
MLSCKHVILIIIFRWNSAGSGSKINQPNASVARRNYEHSYVYLIVTKINFNLKRVIFFEACRLNLYL